MEPSQDFSRDLWDQVRPAIFDAIEWALRARPLVFSANWTLSSKAVSEIGGRLIEDWLIANLGDGLTAVRDLGSLQCDAVRVVPVAGRSIGDIAVCIELHRQSYTLFIDVKAANTTARDETLRFYQANGILKKRPGEAHPNLISIPRAEQWYANPGNVRSDLAIFHCFYRPVFENNSVTFDFMDTLGKGSSLFLLRDISANNVTNGSLGRGQLQLTKVSKLQFTQRTREEFCVFLRELVAAKAEKRRRNYV